MSFPDVYDFLCLDEYKQVFLEKLLTLFLVSPSPDPYISGLGVSTKMLMSLIWKCSKMKQGWETKLCSKSPFMPSFTISYISPLIYSSPVEGVNEN